MSKNILLIAATQQEINPYLQTTPHHDVLIGGVGIPSTMYRLTRQLVHNNYDLVIQAGIAGSFSSSFAKEGHVVQVTHDCFGDLGSFEQGQFNDLQQLHLSTDPVWLTDKTHLLPNLDIPGVKAVTVQTITDDATIIAALGKKWKADIETMEGAAAAYICHQKRVPFIQIRAISNVVGNRDKSTWKLDDAIENLNVALKAIIEKNSN